MFKDLLKGSAETIASQQFVNPHEHTFGVWRIEHPVQPRIFAQFGRTQNTGIIFNEYKHFKKPKKEEHKSNLSDVIISTILQDIKNVEENFEDIRFRQVFFHKFKMNITNLWEFVSEKDYSENLAMLLLDSIENLKAESIIYEQLDAIKEVIKAIARRDITEDHLDYYINYLMEKDIPLVRLPENISDMYD